MDERENGLKRDIEPVKNEVKEAELRLEARIAETKTDLIKWMIGLLVAQSGLIIGVMMKLIHP